jgi:hypothetical protein
MLFKKLFKRNCYIKIYIYNILVIRYLKSIVKLALFFAFGGITRFYVTKGSLLKKF